MNQREYERLKSQAQAEYRRTIEAIERVWQMSGGATRKGPTHGDSTTRKGKIKDAVRQAVAELSGEFSVRDIEKQIQDDDPELAAKIKRPSLSSALKRLEADEEIVLVTPGSGKRASTYRRAG